ncbi:NADH-FMN oxidoreductase RutF, flavin reductase (DIM6/NTAB) family [Lentibacillus persicus]|uniref:NADH-FMN oxidoreductase RutF, flavin reductase (DIM6/NTAB) family n=1 Tax=Lentibacillus persicus TaxID=640948 RepID=A0A1I2AYQ1_9BACI|nr:flavin reductase family protein [Lentibacillus persicus]SFE48113.1 NADH-FMN oxidoreductase RutF, flavin reductase (DIM6/NTAB) family [Lentibacillus persicus]
MDNRQFRNAMGKFATGVNVIATEVNGEVHGMTANAFMSVSMDPKLVIISVKEDAQMLDRIKESQTFAISVLSEEQQKMSMTFAGQIDNDEPVEFEYLDGKPVLPNSLAQIACDVSSEYVEGDHTLFVGKVTDIQLEDGQPLIFNCGRYHSLENEKANSAS